MSTINSRLLRPAVFKSLIALMTVVYCGVLDAQDWTGEAWLNRRLAETWSFRDIAVIQACHGDVQGAKQTALQINECYENIASRVTAVWFCNGRPFYVPLPYWEEGFRVPWSPTLNAQLSTLCSPLATPHASLPPPRVPPQVPAGLRAGYLDAEPKHGALLEFTDERDGRGTRVTSRRYADGYVVIETPGR
jgi:hypothetical protein